MNPNLTSAEITNLEKKCKDLLKEQDVRFVGIINNMGRQVAGGYKESITPLVDEEDHKMSLEHAMEVFLTKDLDDSLGKIDYIITGRKKVFMITVPTEKYSILISAERNAYAEKIVEITMKLFDLSLK
jgi:hypothetical protein